MQNYIYEINITFLFYSDNNGGKNEINKITVFYTNIRILLTINTT